MQGCWVEERKAGGLEILADMKTRHAFPTLVTGASGSKQIAAGNVDLGSSLEITLAPEMAGPTG
jgi:hypothetical protein